jgi:UDP-N-acetylmuramyl pentapeptide phosphotransferase/UDP-N-acetylglucosamine-1-phosphate transferase
MRRHDGIANIWRRRLLSAIRTAMDKRRTPAAGGIFLFLGPVVGALYGIGRGEPILWMLYGFGAGIALALLIWLIDRRKR